MRLLLQWDCRFSGVVCPQFEVVLSQAISFSQKEDSSDNGCGDEEDEDGDGDAKDVLLYRSLVYFK